VKAMTPFAVDTFWQSPLKKGSKCELKPSSFFIFNGSKM
jgi:hypothetical protein